MYLLLNLFCFVSFLLVPFYKSDKKEETKHCHIYNFQKLSEFWINTLCKGERGENGIKWNEIETTERKKSKTKYDFKVKQCITTMHFSFHCYIFVKCAQNDKMICVAMCVCVCARIELTFLLFDECIKHQFKCLCELVEHSKMSMKTTATIIVWHLKLSLRLLFSFNCVYLN